MKDFQHGRETITTEELRHGLLAFTIAETTSAFRPSLKIRALRRQERWHELAAAGRTTLPAKILEQAEADLDGLGRLGARLLCIVDADYPEPLRSLTQPPLTVFVRGRYAPRFNVAVVGARDCSRAGRETAEHFGHALTNAGAAIVSGLALGIDGAAHRGAIRGTRGGPEQGAGMAILGAGLRSVYPAKHQPLADELVDAGGCLISEFALDTPPYPQNFLRRNRLISALSDLTLVVEAAARSGSLVTARHAAEQGRDVGAIPGPIGQPRCAGSNDLLRQGAHVILEPNDVLRLAPVEKRALLSFEERSLTRVVSDETMVPPQLRSVFRAFADDKPHSFDSLVVFSGYGTGELASALLELELLGLIRQLSAGIYARNHVVDTV